MKSLPLLLATLFCFFAEQGQKAKNIFYKCSPCGQDCDKENYSQKGVCTHCQMPLVPASTISFKEVSASAVCDYIAAHPETVLLDVRSQEEFEGKATPNFGTLRRANNIPIASLLRRLSELEKYKGKEILAFC